MSYQNNGPTECQGMYQQEKSTFEIVKMIQQILQKNAQINKFNHETVILLIGGVCVGKSTLGNKMAQLLGSQQDPFKVEDDDKPCTQECSYYQSNKFMIIDTPDLFGTTNNNGEDNVKKIVNYVKEVTDHINAIIFVINDQIEGFKESQKQTLKLFMASMGQQVLRNIGIVFPNLPQNEENATIAMEKAKLVTKAFKELKIESSPDLLPYQFMDCNQELTKEARKDAVTHEPQNKATDPKENLDKTLEKVLDWAETQAKHFTKYINFTAFDYIKLLIDMIKIFTTEQEATQAVIRQEKNMYKTLQNQHYKLVHVSDHMEEHIRDLLNHQERESQVQINALEDEIAEKNAELSEIKKQYESLKVAYEKLNAQRFDSGSVSGGEDGGNRSFDGEKKDFHGQDPPQCGGVTGVPEQVTNKKWFLHQESQDTLWREAKQRKYVIVRPFTPQGNCRYKIYEQMVTQIKYPCKDWEIKQSDGWEYVNECLLPFTYFGESRTMYVCIYDEQAVEDTAS